MYKAIEEFYEPLSRTDAQQYERGQMWWTCCPYSFANTRVTRVWPDGKSVPMDVCEFDPSREHRDEEANTDPSEFYAIVKFKRRPVVILSTPGTSYRDRAWHGGDWFVIAPVRSLREPLTGEYRAAPEFVWGAIRYQYSSVFYLPEEAQFDLQEAVLHLDHMRSLHRSWLLEPRRARLSSDAMVCLDEWIRNYVYNVVRKKFGEDLEVYRQAMDESPQIREGILGKRI